MCLNSVQFLYNQRAFLHLHKSEKLCVEHGLLIN